MNFPVIPKPPTSGDDREMYRWMYQVCEVLNGLRSIFLEHNNTQDLELADDTSSTTTGYKHVTNAQVKKYEDHRLTIGNPHQTEWDELYGTINHLPFNLSPTSVPTTEGTISWNPTDHTLNVQSEIAASVLQVGQENWVRAVNKTGSTIADGKVVYISGAQGNRPKISLAKADSESTSYVIGVTTDDIADNAEGYVTILGLVRGVNTTSFTAGDPLWLSASTAGALTKTRPSAPNHATFVGFALNSTVNGTILVRPYDGFELNELHDVLISTPANYQLLIRDQTAGYWKNTANVLLDDANRKISTSTGDLTIDCGSQKTLVLSTVVWDDVYPSSVTVGNTGANFPSFTAYNGNLKAYEFVGTGVNYKEMNLGFQFYHTVYVGASITISPHLHLYIPDDVTGGVIKFYCEYTWAEIGSTGAIATTTISGTITRGASAGIANNAILEFNSAAVTGSKGISSVFMCRIYRDPADVADTFGASVWLKSADIHYPKDTQGSRQEYVK